MRRALASLCLAVVTAATLVLAPGANAEGDREAPSACGTGLVPVAGERCTHGGDVVPPLVERHASTAPTRSPSSDLCAGNGVNGRRVRAYYGYPSDTVARASTFRAWIRQSVSMADANLDAQTPGADGQHLRMYCANGRKVTVASIALLPIGGDASFTFGDVIGSLTSRVANGLGDTNIDTPRFTYVVFVDNVTCCYGPAGQATIYYDDRPDPRVNLNNLSGLGPRFAMVEIGGSPFSGAYVFLHEVGHTLGAVQHSAPHSSGAGHCYTSADVLCYSDGGPWFDGGGTMQSVCAVMPDGQYPFDCGGGDYYEVDPGGYLASHWNTADSAWLTNPG
jgi:hypothetical protein